MLLTYLLKFRSTWWRYRPAMLLSLLHMWLKMCETTHLHSTCSRRNNTRGHLNNTKSSKPLAPFRTSALGTSGFQLAPFGRSNWEPQSYCWTRAPHSLATPLPTTQKRIGLGSSNLVAGSDTWPALYDNCSRSKGQGHKVNRSCNVSTAKTQYLSSGQSYQLQTWWKLLPCGLTHVVCFLGE